MWFNVLFINFTFLLSIQDNLLCLCLCCCFFRKVIKSMLLFINGNAYELFLRCTCTSLSVDGVVVLLLLVVLLNTNLRNEKRFITLFIFLCEEEMKSVVQEALSFEVRCNMFLFITVEVLSLSCFIAI